MSNLIRVINEQIDVSSQRGIEDFLSFCQTNLYSLRTNMGENCHPEGSNYSFTINDQEINYWGANRLELIRSVRTPGKKDRNPLFLFHLEGSIPEGEWMKEKHLRDYLNKFQEHCSEIEREVSLIADLRRTHLDRDYKALFSLVDETLLGFFNIPKITDQRKVSRDKLLNLNLIFRILRTNNLYCSVHLYK